MKKMTPSNVRIHTRFKGYEKSMRDVWETYNLVSHYMNLSHKAIKGGKIGGLPLPTLWGSRVKVKSVDNTYGAISHLSRKSNPRRALCDAVSTFEVYLSDITTTVFEDYPGKLLGQDNSRSEDGYQKLLKYIVESQDKTEIIERIVEERVRGIFYGKPSSYFTNEKLEFGDYFIRNYKNDLELYEEVTARRNLLVHNGGKVDRKYLRETKGSGFKLRQVVPVDADYLRRSIVLLLGLSAEATGVILKKIYKSDVRGTVAKLVNKFRASRNTQIPGTPYSFSPNPRNPH